MNVLLENPLPIWLLGGISVAILVSAFFKTGSVPWLLGSIAALLATCGMAFIESVVETEREVVERTLQELADAMERGDEATILDAIAPEAGKVKMAARAALKAFVIQQAKIKNNVKVQFQPPDEPTRAVATFNAVLIGGDRASITTEQRVALFFTVDLVKQNERWLVSDYKYEDFREGI